MIVTTEELSQAKDGRIDFEFEETFDEINLVSPARAKLTVSKIGGGFINVKGKVTAQINAVCDNCLKEVSCKYNEKEVEIEIDNNKINYLKKYYICNECNNEFLDDLYNYDVITVSNKCKWYYYHR